MNRLAATPDAARFAIASEDRAAIMDSLILCKFLRGALGDFYGESAEMLRAVTGFDISSNELQVTAARIVALKKLFNVQQGWTRGEDTLPRASSTRHCRAASQRGQSCHARGFRQWWGRITRGAAGTRAASCRRRSGPS